MVAGPLYFAFQSLVDAEMRKGIPGVVKYVKGLAELPEFKNAFGGLKMVETRVRPE